MRREAVKPCRFEKRLRSYGMGERSSWTETFMVFGGSWAFCGPSTSNPLYGPRDTNSVRTVAEYRQSDNGLRLAKKPINCIRGCE